MAKKRFSFIDELNTRLEKAIVVTRAGEARLKKADLRKALEDSFNTGVKAAAGGERVRFPVIGVLCRKDVKARKSGKGTNPFTGAPMTIKARPASKKPRWSFPKSVKEFYTKKSNW